MKRNVLFLALCLTVLVSAFTGCKKAVPTMPQLTPNTATHTPTNLVVSTATVTQTSTNVPENTFTVTQTSTCSDTPTEISSPSFTATFTATTQDTETATPTDTITETETPSHTITITSTATIFQSPTITPTSTKHVAQFSSVADAGLFGAGTVADYMNSGACTMARVGLQGGEKRRALYKFDLSSLNGANIVSARLVIDGGTSSSTYPTVDVYRLGEDWEEGTCCTSTCGGVTWKYKAAPTYWTIEGGDYTTYGSATVSGPQLVVNRVNTFELNPSVISNMAASNNFGFMIKAMNEADTSYFDFSCREITSMFAPPVLIVEYYE